MTRLLFVVMALIPSVCFGVDTNQVVADSVVHSMAVTSSEKALERALLVTGFASRIRRVSQPPTASSVATKSIAIDNNTPFLADQINGKEVWVVRVDSVDIRPEEAILNGDNRWDKKNFEILLDPVSGQVLRISTSSTASNLTPEPDSRTASAELSFRGERYCAFLDSVPEVTFLEALNAAAGCTPLVAEEIIAVCVLHSEGDRRPRPVWIITSRGVPPFEFTSFSKEAPEQDRSRVRCIVDATTGKWLSMSVAPHLK